MIFYQLLGITYVGPQPLRGALLCGTTYLVGHCKELREPTVVISTPVVVKIITTEGSNLVRSRRRSLSSLLAMTEVEKSPSTPLKRRGALTLIINGGTK